MSKYTVMMHMNEWIITREVVFVFDWIFYCCEVQCSFPSAGHKSLIVGKHEWLFRMDHEPPNNIVTSVVVSRM